MTVASADLRGRHVTVVEVGPRDGLQNEPGVVPTATKRTLIRRLVAAGVPAVETTSFVRPDRVPQMADGPEVLVGLDLPDDVRAIALVPNRRGLDAALAAGVREVAVFLAPSESFTRRNVGCSVAESVERSATVAREATAHGLRVRGYVSTVVVCPYEGPVARDAVLRLVEDVVAMGCHEVSLGDTIGAAAPGQVHDLVRAVAEVADLGRVAAHMHDTYGMGLANSLAAVAAGVGTVDASAGGLGGCPFAGPGARGNLATEDLLYALHGSGAETGVDLDAVVATSAWLAGELGRPVASRAAAALLGPGGPGSTE